MRTTRASLTILIILGLLMGSIATASARKKKPRYSSVPLKLYVTQEPGPNVQCDMLQLSQTAPPAGDRVGCAYGTEGPANDARYRFTAVDSLPVTLDAKKKVQGELLPEYRYDGQKLDICAGTAVVDITLQGETLELDSQGVIVSGEEVTLATTTVQYDALPGMPRLVVPFTLDLDDTLHKVKLGSLEFVLFNRGNSLGCMGYNVDGASFFTMSTLVPASEQP